jgi:hypothetical protein
VVAAEGVELGRLLEEDRTIRLVHLGVGGEEQFEIRRPLNVDRDQVARPWFAGSIERSGAADEFSRDVVDAPMLVEVLSPRDDEEHLDQATGIGGVSIQTPAIGTGPKANEAQILHHFQEIVDLTGLKVEGVQDHHRAAVEGFDVFGGAAVRVEFGWDDLTQHRNPRADGGNG